MENLGGRSHQEGHTGCSIADLSHEEAAPGFKGSPTPIQPLSSHGTRSNESSAEWRSGEFYKCLPAKAMSEFELLAAPFSCDAGTVLFAEEQEARSVHFLLEGRVKLTMNSSEGKRLMLGIAGPGEILGLASSISGCPHVITAVAQYPCKLMALPRPVFLDFLLRYPVACQNSATLLGMEYKRGCAQLRILGLTFTASTKLAMLLLQWSAEGQRTELGSWIHCSLTHEEIGEYIGVSRETISRNLSDFKNLALVEQHGSVFLIPSLRALEAYAGVAEY